VNLASTQTTSQFRRVFGTVPDPNNFDLMRRMIDDEINVVRPVDNFRSSSGKALAALKSSVALMSQTYQNKASIKP
jgi:hypothetical protein